MAKKPTGTPGSAFDVWVVEGNKVYKGVPYSVVTDWVQQGRLLAEDRVRPAGTQDTFVKVAKVAALAAFFQKAEPAARVDDVAEALEPAHFDLSYKRADDEEEDVDMIPLIDVALVLLIFFIMTSTVASESRPVNVPAMSEIAQKLQVDPETMTVRMTLAADGQALYGYGQTKPGGDLGEDQNLPEARFKEKFRTRLKAQKSPAQIMVAADAKMPSDTVLGLRAWLDEIQRADGTVGTVHAEGSEAKK